jgi:hypothetical protein
MGIEAATKTIKVPPTCMDCANLEFYPDADITTLRCLLKRRSKQVGFFDLEESLDDISGELPKTGSPRGIMPCGGRKFRARKPQPRGL